MSLLSFRRVHNPLLDVCCEAVERLVHVDIALSRDLEERYSELVRELLTAFGGDRPLVLPVALVANQNLVDALGRMLLYVGEPRPDIYTRDKTLARARGHIRRGDRLLKERSSVTS